MVSFAEIKTNLNSEEKILWKKRNYTNELKELRFTLNILILTIGISIFSVLFYIFTSTINFDIWLSVLILFTILLISGFPLFFFFRIYSEYRTIIKRLELKLNNLRKYEEFFILTNKRWVQKSFYLAKVDNFKNEIYQIVKKNDMAFADLNNIEVIYVSPLKKGKIYHVNFFKIWDKDLEESVLQVFLEENDYQRLMETLRELFHMTKEEHDVIKYGDSVFYCKKEKQE